MRWPAGTEVVSVAAVALLLTFFVGNSSLLLAVWLTSGLLITAALVTDKFSRFQATHSTRLNYYLTSLVARSGAALVTFVLLKLSLGSVGLSSVGLSSVDNEVLAKSLAICVALLFMTSILASTISLCLPNQQAPTASPPSPSAI